MAFKQSVGISNLHFCELIFFEAGKIVGVAPAPCLGKSRGGIEAIVIKIVTQLETSLVKPF